MRLLIKTQKKREPSEDYQSKAKKKRNPDQISTTNDQKFHTGYQKPIFHHSFMDRKREKKK